MIRFRSSGTGVVLLTLFVAAIVDVAIWPDALGSFRPQWMVLVTLYWVMMLPHRIGVFWGFWIGIFQDVLLNTPFGEHALALSITCFLVLISHRRLRELMAPLQSLMIFFLVGIYLLVDYSVRDATGQLSQAPYSVLFPAIASAAVWFPLYGVLRYLGFRFLVR